MWDRYDFDHPTRRALGAYGAVTLEKARQKARDWLELIEVGKDPEIEEERLGRPSGAEARELIEGDRRGLHHREAFQGTQGC